MAPLLHRAAIKMETMKIVVNIKASVLHESGVKGPHGGPGGSM